MSMTENNDVSQRQNIVFISGSLFSLFSLYENAVLQFDLISFIGIEVARHRKNISINEVSIKLIKVALNLRQWLLLSLFLAHTILACILSALSLSLPFSLYG